MIKFLFFLLLFLFPTILHAQNLNAEFQRIQSELQAHPDDLNLKMDLAYLFSQGLEFNRATKLYEEVAEKDPQSLRAWTELCALRTESHVDAEKAGGACRQAVTLASHDYLMHDNLGLSYFKFGRFRQSLKPFLTALSLSPSATLVKNHLAQAFLALREPAVARDYYIEVLRGEGLLPMDEALARYGLFLTEKQLGNYEHAFTAIWETYKLSSNPLYLGKVVSTFLLKHQFVTFLTVGGVVLSLAGYLGKRLNRFLKNEN